MTTHAWITEMQPAQLALQQQRLLQQPVMTADLASRDALSGPAAVTSMSQQHLMRASS